MAFVFIRPDPGGGVGNSTFDGYARRFAGGGESWATIRSGAGDFSDDTSQTDPCVLLSSVGVGSWDNFLRSLYTFDSSIIGSGANVTITTLTLRGFSTEKDSFTDALAVVGSTPASNNEVANSDYSELGTTLYAPAFAMAGWNNGGDNVFTFNATGRAAINVTGITALGVRSEADRSDTEPTGGAGLDTIATIRYADRSGTADDPVIEVTYDPGAEFTYTLDAETVSVTVAVQDVGLFHNRVLSADAATVGVAIQDAALLHGWRLSAEAATVSVTAQDAALLYGRVLSAEVATVGVTAQTVDLLKGWRLDAASVAVAVAIQDANLIYTPIGGPTYTLDAEAAIVVVTPQDVDLLKGWRLDAEAVAVAVAIQAVNFSYSGTFGPLTDAALATRKFVYGLELQLRTNHSESIDFVAVQCATGWPQVKINPKGPDTMSATLLNTSGQYDDERSKSNRGQLFAEGRVLATVNTETQTIWEGRVWANGSVKDEFKVNGQDWLSIINETECDITLAPTEIEVVADGVYRQLIDIGAAEDDRIYGLQIVGGGGDEGFNEATQLQKDRRSWAETNLAVYYFEGGDYINVASRQWNVDWANGSVQILEDDTSKTYFISNLHCNKESGAAGATDVDYAEFLRLALEYVGSDNEGPGFTSGQLDLASTGLDLPIARDFKGKVGDLVAQIESKVQANLKLWYDAASGKIKLRLITQLALGAEDLEIYNAVVVNNSRNITQLFSRVRFTGKRPMPENALAQATTSITDLGGGVDFFGWDGQDTLTSSPLNTFAGSVVRLHDGDRITGFGVRGLVAGSPYDVWHAAIKITLPAAKRLKQVIVVMPPSWHSAHAATRKKDSAWLWPGIRLLSSTDDANYFPVATAISGVRYPPGERVEVNTANILRPVSRYFKLYLGAYKHGDFNISDPSIGMTELILVFDDEFEIIRQIDPLASPPSYYTYTSGVTWQRNNLDLWTRLGARRHRTYFEDLGNRFSESAAGDYALQFLAESTRLFVGKSVRGACDPRVKRWDTAKVTAPWLGDTRTVLVNSATITPDSASAEGTDYLSSELGND